nr:MAG TPA: hypothetical protein [Caudoviricetes sp.]
MQKGQSQVLFCVCNFRQSADYYIAECLPIGRYSSSVRALSTFFYILHKSLA